MPPPNDFRGSPKATPGHLQAPKIVWGWPFTRGGHAPPPEVDKGGAQPPLCFIFYFFKKKQIFIFYLFIFLVDFIFFYCNGHMLASYWV